MFIALYAVTVLVYRSFGGAVATKVGATGLEWSDSETGQVAAEQMTKLNLRLNDQANFIETFVKSLVADMGTLKALERKIDRIDRELQGLISPRAADSSGLGCGNRDDRERCHRAYWTCGALK